MKKTVQPLRRERSAGRPRRGRRGRQRPGLRVFRHSLCRTISTPSGARDLGRREPSKSVRKVWIPPWAPSASPGLWGEDRHFAKLSPDDLRRMSGYLQFVHVPANQEVIGQDEEGDYLLIVLDGSLAVDRIQPWGGRARIAEAHVGRHAGRDVAAGCRRALLGVHHTVGVLQLAVLEARQLDAMMERDPALALALLASLSRKLSLRLRQVSARLSALLNEAGPRGRRKRVHPRGTMERDQASKFINDLLRLMTSRATARTCSSRPTSRPPSRWTARSPRSRPQPLTSCSTRWR